MHRTRHDQQRKEDPSGSNETLWKSRIYAPSPVSGKSIGSLLATKKVLTQSRNHDHLVPPIAHRTSPEDPRQVLRTRCRQRQAARRLEKNRGSGAAARRRAPMEMEFRATSGHVARPVGGGETTDEAKKNRRAPRAKRHLQGPMITGKSRMEDHGEHQK